MKKKEKDNKNKLFGIIGIILLVIIIVVSFILSYRSINKEKISINHLWSFYDVNLANIVSNMDLITSPNENYYWWELKDFDIEDDEYEKILNMLTADIRICYMEFTLAAEEYFKSNPILEYYGVDSIRRDDLDELRKDFDSNSSCLSRFDQYDNLLISEDNDTREKFLNRIENIKKTEKNEIFIKEDPSFDELFYRKYIEVSMIEDLSSWLRGEYYRLK